jgi:hypothetical protein
MLWEEYRERCLAAGDTEKSARNTWDLMEEIKRVISRNAYRAPEAGLPVEAQLARLFIDRTGELVDKNDKCVAGWLREKGAPDLAEEIERGEHWKWHRRSG